MKKFFLIMGIAHVLFSFSSCKKNCECEIVGDPDYSYDYEEDVTAKECKEFEMDLRDDYDDQPEVTVNCFYN